MWAGERDEEPKASLWRLFPLLSERGRNGETGARERKVGAREPGSTAGVGYCLGRREQQCNRSPAVESSGFLTAYFPSGLCGGYSEPHHTAPQLLPGGRTHPLIPEPPPCAGCGLTGPLHCFCEFFNEVPIMC